MSGFTVRIVPPKNTAQMKRLSTRGGKVQFFKDKKHEDARNTLWAALEPHKPEKPLCGPVALEVQVIWPYLKSDVATKATRDRGDLIWHTSKPDLDNWIKDLQDLLVTLRFIESDQSVVDLRCRKYRGPKSGIYVHIMEAE